MRWWTRTLLGLVACGLIGCGGGDSPVPDDATTTPPEIDTGISSDDPPVEGGTEDPAAAGDSDSEAPPFDPGSEAPAFDPGAGPATDEGDAGVTPPDPAPTDNSAVPLDELPTADLVTRLSDPAVRDRAVELLQERGPDVVPELVAALEADDWQVRAGAVYALSLLGEKARAALPDLRTLAENERHESVRDAVAWALDSIDQK